MKNHIEESRKTRLLSKGANMTNLHILFIYFYRTHRARYAELNVLQCTNVAIY